MLKRRFFVLFLALILAVPLAVHAAPTGPTLSASPSVGTFEIGTTFDVNVSINTAGRAINAFKVKIFFEPDKLQVVSPSVGQSIAGIWVRRPSYSNETGEINFEGAVPSPGINTDFGILTTITFRAKSLGHTMLRFSDESALYLNDGQGTQSNPAVQNGSYRLVLPGPQGPLVSSPTHPDQDRWYSSNSVILRWTTGFPMQGYSFILNQTPLDTPDNISEGTRTETTYKNLADGIYYFHIKALQNDAWGGVTHAGIKIQTGGPAKFSIDVSPGTRTTSKTVVLTFDTTDPLSGVDHYEAKVIRLNPLPAHALADQTPLFFEVHSPYILNADDYGGYQLIIRAFNRAGNYTESSAKIAIVRPIFQFIADGGIKIGEDTLIPWYLFWALVVALVTALWYLNHHLFRWHLHIDFHYAKHREEHKSAVERLQELRRKFGAKGLSAMVLVMIALTSLFGVPPAQAAMELSPPVVNLVSEHINNDEIFYIGGRAAASSAGRVVIYLESMTSGETFSFETPVGQTGDWFYTHPTFLEAGNYLLWTQLKINEQASPPSGQIQMQVATKAIQLGSSRISYETVALAMILLFGFALIALGTAAGYYWRKGHKKRKILAREIREAEKAIRQGFALLQRDMQAELDLVRGKGTSREQQLMHDLEEISRHITKEVLDIERAI